MNSKIAYLLAFLALTSSLTQAQPLPVATTTQMEVVPRAGAGVPDYGVRSSMKINPVTGHPSIAHFDRTAKQLIYTAWNGTAWEELVVASYNRDPDPDWFYCSLAYDAAGLPSIAYFNRNSDDLQFARLNPSATAFVSERVDQVDGQFGSVGRFCSLAYASDGKAYLSYYHSEFEYLTQGSDEITPITQDLRVATRSTSGVWSLATVDAVGDVGSSSALTVTASGKPAVSYLDVTTGNVKAAYFNGTAWSTKNICAGSSFTSIGSHRYSSAAVGLFIACKSSFSNRITVGSVMVDTSGGTNGSIGLYSAEFIADSALGRDPSLVVDQKGNAFVSFYDPTQGELRISHGAPGPRSSAIETTPITGDVGQWSSLDIAPDGMASVCYYDSLNKKLKYAKLSGWSTQTIDSGLNIGSNSSIAYDLNGMPVISYHDAVANRIKVATPGSNTGPVSWMSLEIVTKTSTSMSCGPSGQPAFAYYNFTSHQLTYQSRAANGVWSVEIVASIANQGSAPSLALAFGPDGLPAISYYASNSSELAYAKKQANGTWSNQIIVISGSTAGGRDSNGYENALKFNPTGKPTITYTEFVFAAYPIIKSIEQRSDGNWYPIQTLEQRSFYTHSMAYGFTDFLAYSYVDYPDTNLVFVERKENNYWRVETIDTVGDVGFSSSIKYGPEGRPAISYLDRTNQTIKYAERRANGSWGIQTIDYASGQDSSGTSLSYDPQGRPTLSYQGSSGFGLKFAVRIISPNLGPAAPFQVIALTRDPVTKAATLSWPSTAGAKYQVDFSPDLTANSWTPIGSNLNALDGMTFFRTTSLLGQANPRAFFRVKKQ